MFINFVSFEQVKIQIPSEAMELGAVLHVQLHHTWAGHVRLRGIK